MPVIETEVHQKVKQIEGAKYGCHNRKDKFADSYHAPNRTYRSDGSFIRDSVEVPFRMSHTCRYDQSLSDPGCIGCKHLGSGEEYTAFVRSTGT